MLQISIYRTTLISMEANVESPMGNTVGWTSLACMLETKKIATQLVFQLTPSPPRLPLERLRIFQKEPQVNLHKNFSLGCDVDLHKEKAPAPDGQKKH